VVGQGAFGPGLVGVCEQLRRHLLAKVVAGVVERVLANVLLGHIVRLRLAALAACLSSGGFDGRTVLNGRLFAILRPWREHPGGVQRTRRWLAPSPAPALNQPNGNDHGRDGVVNQGNRIAPRQHVP
jgi:hypothetical protein